MWALTHTRTHTCTHTQCLFRFRPMETCRKKEINKITGCQTVFAMFSLPGWLSCLSPPRLSSRLLHKYIIFLFSPQLKETQFSDFKPTLNFFFRYSLFSGISHFMLGLCNRSHGRGPPRHTLYRDHSFEPSNLMAILKHVLVSEICLHLFPHMYTETMMWTFDLWDLYLLSAGMMGR